MSDNEEAVALHEIYILLNDLILLKFSPFCSVSVSLYYINDKNLKIYNFHTP